MRHKLFVALAHGALVGALVGAGESLILLARIPVWPLVTWTIPIAMAIYGVLAMLLTGVWGLFALRLDSNRFQMRSLAFSGLAMVYLLGGFYANRLWFPELSSVPSLLFTGVWTLLCLLGVWVLLQVRRAATPDRTAATGVGMGRARFVMTLGLVGLAAVSLVLPRVRRWSDHPVPPRTAGPSDRPNVLLIVMDTTRADHLSCYGYPRRTTPNLDRLANDGVLFEQARSAAIWTLPAHASLFTGLFLSQHGADRSHMRLDDRFTTIAELLHDRGYQTAGFSNNSWVSPATNFHQGFEVFEEPQLASWVLSRLALPSLVEKLLARSVFPGARGDAAMTNRRIRRWFNTVYEPHAPFFLFVNYLEPHYSYEPPRPYRRRFFAAGREAAAWALEKRLRTPSERVPPILLSEEQRAILSDLYDGELAYLDARIGELLADLARRALLDETLVVVTSDHGENLGDHQLFQHQFCLYETLLHVPLILRYPPALPAGVRVTEPVSLVDVVPTVIKMLGLEAPSLQALLPGQSWAGSPLAVPADRAIVAEYEPRLDFLPRARRSHKGPQPLDEAYFTRHLKTLCREGFKFIWASDGRHELYDLGQDPEESHNLMSAFPEKAKAMEEELFQHLLTLKPIGSPEPAPDLNTATREQLRALGYLQ